MPAKFTNTPNQTNIQISDKDGIFLLVIEKMGIQSWRVRVNVAQRVDERSRAHAFLLEHADRLADPFISLERASIVIFDCLEVTHHLSILLTALDRSPAEYGPSCSCGWQGVNRINVTDAADECFKHQTENNV